ncbi:uncharacterized protein HMPREF1541_07843 [Cyphellophora europaea CBS 101466]|uniref:Zn(2)-C6 fungal-type domain-containing protein n=1 Tax=Cyphellophora europaea (strain CBS 101466) TaxID=1220924 RepID=W2RK57_CYPE1|nr:uncharacterized protein HMPREF1541_07843 [Cyphellophora europaea CBS 101466]ETN36856.1 hypothetical protein HMPREF1541_07843 [Cyphellophora europaea CBS 101466]
MPNLGRSNGCWTCRLRRKKCDGAAPECQCCRALGIECYFEPTKPDWMDNGSRQKRKAADVKAKIKLIANRRRTGAKLQGFIHELGGDGQSDESVALSIRPASPSSTTPELIADVGSDRGRRQAWTESQPSSSSTVSGAGFSTQLSPDSRARSHNLSDPHFILEHVMLMSYIDHIHPILYPFHRPSVLEGGRCWILPIALSHDCLRHVIVALATYCFGTMQVIPGSTESVCGALDGNLLQRQTEIALQSAQRDLQAVRISALGQDALEKSRVLANTVQLLTVETYVGTNNWKPHLDAAVSLSSQIIEDHSFGEGPDTGLSKVVEQLSVTVSYENPHPPLWTPPQASYRFYTAVLVFSDVVASTALERAPILRPHFAHILCSPAELTRVESPKLNLLLFFGVENLILVMIADIAALAEWKRMQTARQWLSMPELVRRGADLEVRLQHIIDRLDTARTETTSEPATIIDGLAGVLPTPPSIINAVNRIWARAAKAYLYTTVSGWQLGHPELRANISETISLLIDLCDQDTSTVPAWLRALAWPICVTGCATYTQEEVDSIRRIFRAMDGLKAVATVSHLIEVVEKVWSNRSKTSDSGTSWQNLTLASMLDGVLLI